MLLTSKQERGRSAKKYGLCRKKRPEHIVHNITIIRSVASRHRG
ncbi:hypothetical protein HMPREF3220_02017 [Citrobacter koseri]|nr:hypothetical protein HMPREF3207_04595 [Citrobacter koseri]KWZ99761.1 hypothetical protein HMPREF3220_02017 [Citrobacter koseri]